VERRKALILPRFALSSLFGLNSPRPILREAYSAGLIDNEELWLNMLKDGNSTSHLYDEAVAIRNSKDVQGKYLNELNDLLRKRVANYG
jgi:nucleotidyltransferase substrate binding protein (TIGR01987 family)